MISNFYLYISWNVDPALYDGFITLRYYSLFFALSFIIGFQIVKKMFDNESAPEQWMDKLLVYTVVGTILGARLGHVIFYEPNYYLENISRSLMLHCYRVVGIQSSNCWDVTVYHYLWQARSSKIKSHIKF